MRKKKTVILANKPTYHGYSYGFKVTIVEQIENGQISQNQAANEYDVSRDSIHKTLIISLLQKIRFSDLLQFYIKLRFF